MNLLDYQQTVAVLAVVVVIIAIAFISGTLRFVSFRNVRCRSSQLGYFLLQPLRSNLLLQLLQFVTVGMEANPKLVAYSSNGNSVGGTKTSLLGIR